MENAIPVIILILAGVLALCIAGFLLILLLIGAAGLLGWASEQGFVGVAVYFACWVFLLPLMILGCIICGAVSLFGDR